MLSYRHAFHAGNHADIFKHMTLYLVQSAYCKKDKPFVYFDTHAGACLYNLEHEWALQTAEADSGIKKIVQYVNALKSAQIDNLESAQKNTSCAQNLQEKLYPVPECIEPFINFVCELYSKNKYYAGSPALVSRFARQNDELVLMELHPTEIDITSQNVKTLKKNTFFKSGTKRIHLHNRNGFEGALALTPPRAPLPSRGFVLIDPSYEQIDDFAQVCNSALALNKRWSGACVCIWYPLLTRRAKEIASLKNTLKQDCKDFLCAELCVSNPSEWGLFGSGMLFLNAPYMLDCALKDALAWLCKAFTFDTNDEEMARWSLES